MIHDLKAYIVATNKANQYANELYEQLAPIFTPLVGLKIEKVNGSLLEKYKTLLPQFPNTPSFRIFRHFSEYNLAWNVEVMEKGNNSWETATDILYLADIKNHVLTRLYEHPQLRTNYTYEEIQHKQEIYKQLKKDLQQAKQDLYPFPEPY